MISSPKRKQFRIISVLLIFAFILAISGCVDDRPKEIPKNYTNSLGMEFVLIPAGEFQMGASDHLEASIGRSIPVHNVTIQKPFYMSKYEVTQKQWTEIMGSNPSNFTGDNLPVDSVLWPEAQQFILKLNVEEGAKGSDRYHLPSEAEWEYACRAGTSTRFSFGNNFMEETNNITDYGWTAINSNETTHPVGQKLPNPWGLYDMHGNVWELTQDSWHDNYTGAPTDGSAWMDKNIPAWVGRGGSWQEMPNYCTSSFRGSCTAGHRMNYLGFRLVKDV